MVPVTGLDEIAIVWSPRRNVRQRKEERADDDNDGRL